MFRRSGYRFADKNMRQSITSRAWPDSEGTGHALDARDGERYFLHFFCVKVFTHYLGSLRKARLGRKSGWTYVRRLVTMGALGVPACSWDLARGDAVIGRTRGHLRGQARRRKSALRPEVVKQWCRPMGSAPPLLTADEWYKLVDSKVDDPQLTPATEPVSSALSRSADTLGALCLHAMYPAPSRRKLFPHA